MRILKCLFGHEPGNDYYFFYQDIYRFTLSICLRCQSPFLRKASDDEIHKAYLSQRKRNDEETKNGKRESSSVNSSLPSDVPQASVIGSGTHADSSS